MSALVDEDFAPHLARLDLQEGDIVTVRTERIVDPAKLARWQDGLERLIRAQGWRNVSVIILDAGTEISVDRPAWPDTRMAHQSRVEPQAMQG